MRSHRLQGSAIPADWEFADADTRQHTHDLHRYSGKFIPQIARQAIELITDPGDEVLDPYAGSGTTLLEAALIGRRATGVDMSPLAVLIARVKVTPVDAERLGAFWEYACAVVDVIESDGHTLVPPSTWPAIAAAAATDSRLDDPWFTKWFQPDVLRDLVHLDHALNLWPDSATQDIGRVAMSGILRRSSRAHSGYPNVMYDRREPKRARPLRPFLRSLERAIHRVSATGPLIDPIPTMLRGDATSLPMDDNSVTAVVTHPPYIGSVPYAEYGALSLKWLGYDPKTLDEQLTGGKRQRKDVLSRFQAGYSAMLAETGRVLRPGGHAFLMVGSPTVRGELVDLGALTLEYAEAAGLQTVGIATRKGSKRRANKMGEEQLLFFVKP
jgi:SAM-dependent methyltransferase